MAATNAAPVDEVMQSATQEAEAPRTIFHIPQSNMAAFEAACAKLSRKAARLGFPPIVPTVLGLKTLRISGTDKRLHRVCEVFLDAKAPRIDGWTFAATIDHSHESGNIVRTVPNTPALPPHYRTAAPRCEHCNLGRYRRDTYVLRSDDGATVQVGKSCLRDFLGHDPAMIAHMAEYLSQAAEAGEGHEAFSGGDGKVHVRDFASFVAMAVRLHGWVSARVSQETDGRVTATRSLALGFFRPDPKHRHLVPHRTAEDFAVVEAALAWAEGLSETGTEMSDYEHGINVVAKSDFVEHRSLGLLASIVGVFLRNSERELARRAEREARAALPPSQHVGAVKDILRDLPLTVIGLATLPDTGYGASHLVRMADPAGNVYVWKSSTDTKLAHRDRIMLKGTVKAHREYEGVRQTWLTRCKFVVMPTAEG